MTHRPRRLPTSLLALALGPLSCSGTAGQDVSPPPSDPDAGTHPIGCAPGTRPEDDGSCLPAGIAADACATGFAADDAGGCTPILPADPCPAGTMAIPGETACHPVARCAAGKWGDAPTGEGTVFVDGSYMGADADGTMDRPWPTLTQAVAAAMPGSVVAIAAGTYAELVKVSSPLTFWGACPDTVILEGAGLGAFALVIESGASGSQVHDVSFQEKGLGVTDAQDVVIERVWIHDTADWGIAIADAIGPASATLHEILVESVTEIGIAIVGSEVTMDAVVVRDTKPLPLGKIHGRAVDVENQQIRSRATITSSVFERLEDVAIFTIGSDLSLEGSVIRDVEAQESDGTAGWGLQLVSDELHDERAKGVVRGCSLERTRHAAVVAQGADLDIESTVIRDTRSQKSDGALGTAIAYLYYDGLGTGSAGSVRSCLFEGSHTVGALVEGSEVTVESTIVRGTVPRESTQEFGGGIIVQYPLQQTGKPTRSKAAIRWSVFEDQYQAGVSVVGSELEMERTLVRGTKARPKDGLYGDGLVVFGEQIEATAKLDSVRIEDSARAGVANFAAALVLGDNELECNGIHLDGETIVDETGTLFPFSFDDLGGNGCGCGDAREDCVVLSTNLDPPEAFE